jgi:hypothetical protein
MTGSRPDDLAEARAADRLNTWLDRHRSGAMPRPGEPPLAAAVREAEQLAATRVPGNVIQGYEDHLWEELMLNHKPTGPTSVPASVSPAVDWRPPVAGRHPDRDPRLARRIGHRAMGLVATLTLVALVGLSGLAVYLSSPGKTPPPTSLAAVGGASPTSVVPTVAPTPVRADATAVSGGTNIWMLPDSAYEEVPAADTYGVDWHTISTITLVQQPQTSFQTETRYYVNNDGSRIRIMLVRYEDDAQFDEAFTYFTKEVQRYQASMYFYDEPTRPERLTAPLDGCIDVVRAEGLEWVTSFQVTATLCRSSDPHIVVLVSVSGDNGLDRDLRSLHPADAVVARVIDFMRSGATPVAAP